MNEQIIDDLYNRAKSKGYNRSRDEFVSLLHSNQEVFNDNYTFVRSKGYKDSEDKFSTLIGKNAAQPEEVKKKEIQVQKPIQNATELPLEGTSSELQKPTQKPENEQGWLLNTVSALDKGFTKNLIGSPVKGLGTLLEGATGKGFVSDALINFGDYFNKAIDEITPQDESYKNSLSDQFAQAFGQVASQVATGAIGMAGKAGALASAERAIASQATKAAPTVGTFVKGAIGELKNPTVVSSGLSMGQAEFDRAKQAGATDEQAFEAFYKNAAVGSVLEKIPVMQFLKRFDKATAHGLTDYLKTKAVHGLTGGVEEMTTEVLQQLYANQTAADIYNINQKLFEDVGTSGGVGFGVGFLLNAMGANVKLLKKQGKNEEAAAIEGQMSQFENDMKKGGPSTYKFNGIPIKSRDDMVNLINKMDAEGLSKANIQVTNDPELAKLMQDRIVVTSTKEQVRQGNPNLNDASLDAITELELELKKMEGNTTQTGKEKAAFIKQQIKNIQENPLADKPKQGLPQEIASLKDDEVVTTTVKTIDEVPEQFRDRAEFVEGMQGYTRKLILGLPIGKKEAIDGSGYRYSMSGKEVKTLASQRLGIEESQTKTQQNAVQEQGANESVLRTEQPQVGLQKVGEGNAQPETTTEKEAITNEGPKEEIVRVQDAINGDNIFIRDGQKGKVRLDGQTVVFETDDKIVELGNVDELQNSTLDNFGISKEQELDLTLNDDNSITYNGKNYFNNYSNPELAFSKDKDGNYSVSLETANGQKRTFRGQQADQIVYQSRLKNFEQNATREQIDEANRLADESIGIEEEIRQTSPQREGKAVGQVTETKTVTAPTVDLGQQLAERITVTPTEQVETITPTTQEQPAKPKRTRKATTVSSKTQVEPAKPVEPIVEAPKIEATTQEQPVVEEQIQPTVEEEEVFEPMTIKNTTHETFTKDNASYFDEDQRMSDNGKEYTYLSKIVVPLTDKFTGDEVGSLVKIIDEDGTVSWEAEDVDGIKLGKEPFDTKKEAQQAVIDAHNKQKLKEFNKEKKAKEKAKEKKAQADAKKKAKTEQKKNESSKTQVEPPKVDDLLNLDTKDKTNLKKVYDFLDNIDKGLTQFGRETAGTNIALPLAKAIVKTLKSFVNAGITLQEAINKAAIKHKVTKDNIIEALQKVAVAMQNVSEGISEFELPGYNQLSSMIDGRIAAKEDLNIVTEAVKQSDTYKGATDVQKDQLVREVRKRFGKSQKSSPSAVKNDIIFGIGRIFSTPKDITNITMSEKEALVKQIKDLGRGAKNAKQAVQIASEELSKQVKELVRKGKLTTTQASNVLRRFSKVNLLSQISIDKFVNHMAKVFANADYAAKLSESNKLRKELKSLSKDPDRNADLRKLAEKFVNIEPSMVENIDEYLSTAKSISDSVKGPKIIGEKLSFSPIVNIEETTNYINKQIDQQNETLQKQIADEIEGIEGVDLSEFSYEELLGLLEKNTKATKDDDKIVRSIATKAFDIFKSLINSMVENKVDPFTGEAVIYRPSQVEVINNFMNMDLNLLKTKDLAKAVHALMNFVQNKSTAGMEAVVSKYNGEKNSRIAVQEKIKSNPIKMFFNERFGKLMAENFMTLPALFERLFMTKSKSNRIQNLMGVADLVQKRAEAMTKANAFVSKYVNNFYKSKPNNEAFNTRNNMTERGMVAFMIRTVIGTQAQMKAEFNRRKGLIEQSIKALSQGNEQEQEKSKVYQEVYDKIVKDSENIEDVKSKSDAKNLEAVEYWTKEWDNLFEQFSDVASNVYNKVLEKELNYNPDNHKKLAREKEIVNFDDDESAFLSNDGMIYTKESNGLISVKRPKTLSVNEDTDRTERYIDLDFDYNNSKSLYDGLTDVYTAAPIRQVQAFLNSDSYSKIIPNTDDADLLKRRMRLYIQNIRGKNIYVNEDELSKTIKTLNQLASVGVGQALGGVSQIVKQSVPVLVNTLFNAGGLDISSAFNADKNNFMNNSGYGIANRGSASQADVDSLNKLIKKASESNLEKVGEFIKQANELWLKIFLEKPDAFVARMSWMTYYEKSLKQQGIDSKGIDYKTHKVNEKAAQYAQQMVDRQQNISDVDMSGKAFSEKEPTKNAILKMIAPFASFRLNQFVRVSNDVNVLKNWNSSTVEDRKDAVSSLAGFSAELATFKIISIGFTLLYGALALKFRDKEESEEEYQKRLKNTIKSQATSTVTDLISPLPMLDKYVQGGMSNTISTIQDIMKIDEKERFNIYGSNKSDDIRDLGTFGIPLERAGQTFDLIWLSNGGSFKNQFNQKRWLNQKDQDVLKKTAIPVSLMTTFGLLPNDFNTIVRSELNGAKKDATGTEGGKSDVQVMEDIEAKQATERNKIEKQQKEDLLGDFKNESDMKKYDRKAWEKNFGEKSEWYKDHKEEMDAERKARAEERKALDEENDYVPKTKSSRSKGGLFDNSSKGSRGLFDESKKSGGLFGKKKKW